MKGGIHKIFVISSQKSILKYTLNIYFHREMKEISVLFGWKKKKIWGYDNITLALYPKIGTFEQVQLSTFLMCLKNCWWVPNSIDTDQMLNSVASDLGLYCLLRHICPNI